MAYQFLIIAQACDAEIKKAELNCKGSAACGLSTASKLIYSGDNKTVVMLILKTCVHLLLSTQKTDQESIPMPLSIESIMALVSIIIHPHTHTHTNS